eukprot:12970244-Heterocapsa_arctica.AAC.1
MADISAWIVEIILPNVGIWSRTISCRDPDNKGNAALRAVGNKLPLHRRHIRSDAKFASGMTLEAAGQRLP